MRLHPYLLPLGLVLAFSACKKEKPEEIAGAMDVFPVLVAPPNAKYVSRAGTAEALAIVLRTNIDPEATAKYYRAILRPPRWSLVSDGKDNTGMTLLYAEHANRPLWIRIWPDTGTTGSLVELTGAVAQLHPDSVAAMSDSEAIAAGKLPKPAATFVPMAPPTSAPRR